MQTILGANGTIGQELAKELKANYKSTIRLVSRNPKRINKTDTIYCADLLNANDTNNAIQESNVVYFVVGLPMDSALWKKDFPVMLRNVIQACEQHNSKLVYLDNTYLYGSTKGTLTEATPFKPNGSKGKTRALMADMVLNEMAKNRLNAMICRAPEFYGPLGTKSITNSILFNRLAKNLPMKIFVTDKTLRTLIWAPDASKALALLGNTPEAYGQTWHLPCDDNRLTYEQLIATISQQYGKELDYKIARRFEILGTSLFKKTTRELVELLPRYAVDNIFDSSKFKRSFPDFKITSYTSGLAEIIAEIKHTRHTL